MTGTCPIHGQPWKVVPAGISRTSGKPYNAFLACPVKDCKMRPANGTAPAPVQTAIPGVAPAPRPSKDARYAHCLSFAGRLFEGHGTEEGIVAEAMELARHLLEGWPE